MEALCSECGIDDAYYHCDPCNKNFCIGDWEKEHSTNPHPKLRITFRINEKSKEILIDFFEWLIQESLDHFNNLKQNISKGFQNTLKLKTEEYIIILSTCRDLINYLIKTNTVKKKLLYFPVEYFLMNSPDLAEKYVKGFDPSKFHNKMLVYTSGFLLHNYLRYDFTNIWKEPSLVLNDPDYLWIFIAERLQHYLKGRQYAISYEFLSNSKDFLVCFRRFQTIIKDLIEVVQHYLTYLITKNFNVNLSLWKKAQKNCKKVSHATMFFWCFYFVFQWIFFLLGFRKYFVKCSKILIKALKNPAHDYNLGFVHRAYSDISKFYSLEGNIEKYEKYKIKAYHIFVKKNKLTTNDEHKLLGAFTTLIELIEFCFSTKQIEKVKRFSYKFASLYKKHKPSSLAGGLWIMAYYGMLYYFNHDYKNALKALTIAEKEMKVTKFTDDYLASYINYYFGKIFFMKKNHKEAVKYIYRAKEIMKTQSFFDDLFSVQMNTTLGEINLSRGWLEESLKYFSLAKELLLKIGEFENFLYLSIEYNIGKVLYYIGETSKPLEIFQHLLYMRSTKKFASLYNINEMISLNYYIAELYYKIGNTENFKIYILNIIECLQNSQYHANLSLENIAKVVILCISMQNQYELCEEICLKAIEKRRNSQNNIPILFIHAFLLEIYEIQNNYVKSNQIMDYLKSNLVFLNNKASPYTYIFFYFLFGQIYYKRKHFENAEIFLKKAEVIIDTHFKTFVDRDRVYLCLGLNYKCMKKFKESELYLLKALDIVSNVNYNIHNILYIISDLADLYWLMNDTLNQKRYLWEYTKLCREKNVEHYDYIKNISLLIDMCKKDYDNTLEIKCKAFLDEYVTNFKLELS